MGVEAAGKLDIGNSGILYCGVKPAGITVDTCSHSGADEFGGLSAYFFVGEGLDLWGKIDYSCE